MLVKYVGEAVTVLLILGGELVEELGVSGKVLALSKADGGESLAELNGFEGWLGMEKVLSL